MFTDMFRLTAKNEIAAVVTSARSNINDMVRCHYGFGIVFYNQYCIALIPQGFESFQ